MRPHGRILAPPRSSLQVVAPFELWKTSTCLKILLTSLGEPWVHLEQPWMQALCPTSFKCALYEQRLCCHPSRNCMLWLF
jgi:hypothetical protein